MGILGALASFFTSILSSSVARFIALKILLTSLFLTILPYVLKKVFIWIVNSSLDLLEGALPSSVSPVVIQLTGLAGFLGSHLKLDTFISVLISAVILRFTLSFMKSALKI